LQNIYTED